MRFALSLILLFTTFNVFANFEKINILEEFLSSQDLKIFNTQIEDISSPKFELHKELEKLKTKEFKLTLTYLFLNKGNNLDGVKFKDLTALYFFETQLPRRDLLTKKINEFVKNYKVSTSSFNAQFPEIEEIIWFFVISENENLFKFLNENKIKVQEFISIIRQKQEFEFVKNILYTKQDEIKGLLWEGKVSLALPLVMQLPNENEKAEFLARIYFQTKNPKYKIYAEEVIKKADFTEDGLTYDYIKYLSKTEHYKRALKLLNESKINENSLKITKFWSLVEELYRYYIDEGEFQKAYNLMAKIQLNESSNTGIFLRAEFLAGFTALRFLNNEKLALKHFEAIYNSKYGSVYAKSRGAYFISRVYKQAGKQNLERRWLITTSKYLNTFYGIIALEKLNNIEPVLLLGLSNYTDARIKNTLEKRNEIHKIYFDEHFTQFYSEEEHFNEQLFEGLKQNINFKIGLIMLLIGREADAKNFFSLSVSSLSLKEAKFAFNVLSFYAKQTKLPNANFILNAFSSKASNKGVILVESYPFLDYIINQKNIQPNSLIHAIIKQESNFTLRAISGPGAVGLMQVMPATGRIVSRSINVKFNTERLKNDYKYNILIGSYYLDLLLNRFGKAYPFALIGYNAGPNRVASWKKRFFEPQTTEDMIDFIELIPFKETREYILRVMENEVIYNYLMENHLGANSRLPIQKKDQVFNEFLKKRFKR